MIRAIVGISVILWLVDGVIWAIIVPRTPYTEAVLSFIAGAIAVTLWIGLMHEHDRRR